MPQTEAMPDDHEISFGPFRLHPAARLLEKEGIPVKLGDRALDVLIFSSNVQAKWLAKENFIPEFGGMPSWTKAVFGFVL